MLKKQPTRKAGFLGVISAMVLADGRARAREYRKSDEYKKLMRYAEENKKDK